MSDFVTLPRQDNYQTTLSADMDSSQNTMIVSTAPNFTTPGSNFVYVGIDYDVPSKFEVVKATMTAGSTTININTRGIAIYYGGSSTATSHSSGAKVIISDNWKVFEDIATAVNSKVDKSGSTLTGPLTGPVYANAAARDAAITAPANGQSAYLTAEGKWTDYVSGAWSDRASGTNPNASTTVAGKLEEASLAQALAGTATDTTGAPLALTAGTHGTSLNPTGAIMAYAGSAAPTGWLLCDGSAVSRATYATLFAAISTNFGAGDGSTTFNLPDLRGRAPYGKSAAGTYNALNNSGGAETATLTTNELPAHTHGSVVTGGTQISNAQYNTTSSQNLVQTLTTGSSGSAGSGNAFSIRNPYLVVNYIIKT